MRRGENGKNSSDEVITGMWRRVALDCHQLYSLFPSIHANNIAQVLDCFTSLASSQHRSIGELGQSLLSSSSGVSQVCDVDAWRIVSAQNLLQAFQVSEYLFNPRDSAHMHMDINRANSSVTISHQASYTGTNASAPSASAVANM